MTAPGARGRAARVSRYGQVASTYLAMVGDAVGNLGNRPWRSAMSAFGIVIGTASAIGLSGLTATNEAHIAALLLEDRSPHIVLRDDAAASGTRRKPLDRSAIDRVRDTLGTVAVSAVANRPSQPVSALPPGIGSAHLANVVVADDQLEMAAGLNMRAGRSFDIGHVERGDRVALIGEGLARRLNINVDEPFVAVFVEGEPYGVMGVFDGAHADPSLLYSIVVPPPPSLTHNDSSIDTSARPSTLPRTSPSTSKMSEPPQGPHQPPKGPRAPCRRPRGWLWRRGNAWPPATTESIDR